MDILLEDIGVGWQQQQLQRQRTLSAEAAGGEQKAEPLKSVPLHNRHVFGIHSMTTCLCGYVMLDEQVIYVERTMMMIMM